MLPIISEREQAVLMALANHCDVSRDACVSQKKLAEVCALSVRSVRRSLLRLSEQGVIAIHRRLGGGRGGCNRYRLLPDPPRLVASAARAPRIVLSWASA